MATQTLDLWSLALERPQVDPNDLALAVVEQAGEDTLDYRTRLLIRDSVAALRLHWGERRVEAWLQTAQMSNRIRSICQQDFEEVGFPSLRRRLVEKTRPELVRQFFENLGGHLRTTLRIEVGGSIALIMPGYVSRRTEDIDIVGEVPKVFRDNHQLMEQLQNSFALYLGHVQPHYFPRGWRERVHYLDSFGNLEVYLVDVYDVLLSKLFSSRFKDQEDLRLLIPQLDKETIVRKLREDAFDFLEAPRLLEFATANWKILFGEPLPS